MIVYKTTNLENGKFYVGQDSNNNPSYLGSGLLLKKAIKKYGKESFKKEQLCECSNRQELNEKEIYWIEQLNPPYNIAKGGSGGDTFTNNPNKQQAINNWRKTNKEYFEKPKVFSEQHVINLRKAYAKRIGKTFEQLYGESKGKELRQLFSDSRKGSKNPFYQKTHSQNAKAKIKASWIERRKLPAINQVFLPQATIEIIEVLYCQEKIKAIDIARILSISHKAVRKTLANRGIKLKRGKGGNNNVFCF